MDEKELDKAESDISMLILVARRKANMTILELAEKSGVNRNTISSIEGGNVRGVRLDTLGNICKVLKIEINFHLRIQSKDSVTPSTTIQYFDYEHLPPPLQAISKPIHDLAHLMGETLPDGSEKSAGMRKLLEAKDSFVRAGRG